MLQHMALVPHGIREYAKKSKLPLMDAYDLSSRKFLRLIDWVFRERKIETFTFYGLSYEAIITRTEEELIPIFEVETTTYKNLLSNKTINEGEVEVQFVGDFSKLPKYYRRAMEELQEKTKNFDKKSMYIFIGYNSTQKKMKNFEEWKEQRIDLLINMGEDTPLEIDEFAEKHSIDKFFPEINEEDINEAVSEYYSSL
ncbi:MAG: undecaprenyl diphosphate synthase family protein [Euryarchaeota archaeon]|nr:undecaprenyl diphosphate synthase family protein [Euryarchaeota archaeon]